MSSTNTFSPNSVGRLDFPTPTRPTHLDTTGDSGGSGTMYTRKEQMEKVLHTMRARDVKIAVISNGMDAQNYTEDKACATSIATELNKMLSGSKVLVYEYEITNRDSWVDHLRSGSVKYYIFVNLPPYDPYHTESSKSDFFDPRSLRIAEVVVVRERSFATTPGGTRTTIYTPMHYLEKFQHLDGSPRDIASKALCHFASEWCMCEGRRGGEGRNEGERRESGITQFAP